MIIDKQNLLQAGACEAGADDAEIICKFPCEYEYAVQKLRDDSRNDLAAWMVLFKGQIIQTTVGWYSDKYRAQDINKDNIWVEVKTNDDLLVLIEQIKDEYISLHSDFFNAFRLIPIEGHGTRWEDVDLLTTTEDGNFAVFNFQTAIYDEFTNLADAKSFQAERKQEYKNTQFMIKQGEFVVSADQTESTWININYAAPS